MILHVVLFKPKPNFDEDARRGLARAFADAIDGIKLHQESTDWSPTHTVDRMNN